MTPDRDVQLPQLHQLARLYGVQLAYTDTLTGRPKRASPDALLAVLRALGAPVEGFQDVPAALRERRQALWQRVVEPVVAAWDGSPGTVPLRLPASWAEARASCFLQLESGEARNWTVELKPLRARERVEVEGARYVVKSLTLPSSLPWGYHQLRVEIHGQSLETLLIGAPLHAYALPDEGARRWGVFLPLYALHSRRSPAGGDFSDLNALRQWAEGLGASTAGCLPLLAAFLDEPFAPSPYRPASCLFWNEFYLDVARIPELERSPAAQARLRSAEHRKELEALGAQPLVDYRRTLAWKRQVLEELARSFFAEPSPRQAPFERFRDAHPELEDYARFRAAVERQRIPWTAWPQPQRDGVLQGGDYDEEARRYHVYVQWQAQEQLQAVSEEARQNSPGLYLDLPLGVHPEGYDVWRYRSVFALDASGGAPPDDFFVKGQNWGFPPLHPEKVREQAHRYTIACLRHHCRKAGILRIDHVMSLHRLFWIPRGGEVSDGAYVRRPAEELYAILTLESHRNKTLIVGEDLGTVPRAVRQAMARHRIFRSYVL
ncbi:MAG: 4-alpha-glucanotransferase, partial [Acidobacteriota bacterium]